MSEKEDFFLAPFVPPPIKEEEVDALPAVPVDKSSAIGMDAALQVDGEDDNVGEFCGSFPRRNLLKAPSHRLRGGVPHGDDVAIITESELPPVFTDEQEVDLSIN